MCFTPRDAGARGIDVLALGDLGECANAGHRPHEKGGEHHVMPCHRALAKASRAWIDTAAIAEDREGFLFRPSRGTDLSGQPMTRPDGRG